MRLHRAMNSVVVAAVLLACVGPVVAGQNYKGFERGGALIAAEELKRLIDAKDSKLVVLAVLEPVSYLAGHIPGSINVWRPDYELKVGQPYPFDGMLLEGEAFQDFARGLGIDNDSKVVVYDEKYDAMRVWRLVGLLPVRQDRRASLGRWLRGVEDRRSFWGHVVDSWECRAEG